MRTIVVAIVIGSLLAGTAALGKNPPKDLKGPAPLWNPRSPREDDRVPAKFDGPQRQFADAPYLGGCKRAISVTPGEKAESASIRQGGFAAPGEVAILTVPWYQTPLYSINASNRGSGRSMEAGIYTLVRNSATSTITAFMHRPSGANNYHTRIATSSDLSPAGGSFVDRGPIYIPTGYTDLVDPWLAANPMTVGVRPGAVYLTALAGYRPPGQKLANPTTVRAYASDDGGATWSTGVLVASKTSSDTYKIDKPVSDVSLYWETLGYLYVAWLEIPASGEETGGPNVIKVRRNWYGLSQKCRPTGGGCVTSWDSTIIVHSGQPADGAHMPQIVVNPNNGHVYLFYLTSNTNYQGSLRMYRSMDYGMTWSTSPITIVDSIRLTGNLGYLQRGVLGIVSPTAKFNTATGKVIVTWHATTTTNPTDQTALYYTTFDPDVISGPVSPYAFETDELSELHPSADADNAGNVLVTYYKSLSDGSGYLLYGACRNPSGSGDGVCAPGPVSPPDEASYWDSFLGDYRDTFYFSDDGWSRFDATWTRVLLPTPAWSELFVTGVQ